jgi:hypothetical protein
MSVFKYHAFIFLDRPPPWRTEQDQPIFFLHHAMKNRTDGKRELPFVCWKQKTEEFVFLGWQAIISNRQLLVFFCKRAFFKLFNCSSLNKKNVSTYSPIGAIGAIAPHLLLVFNCKINFNFETLNTTNRCGATTTIAPLQLVQLYLYHQ